MGDNLRIYSKPCCITIHYQIAEENQKLKPFLFMCEMWLPVLSLAKVNSNCLFLNAMKIIIFDYKPGVVASFSYC